MKHLSPAFGPLCLEKLEAAGRLDLTHSIRGCDIRF
jgi:hypothetical protein